jgi:hypothetical protein
LCRFMIDRRRVKNVDYWILCSNSIWKDGELTVTFRKPFDLIADMQKPVQAAKSIEQEAPKLVLAEA